MNVFFWSCLIFGIMSLLYYFLIIIYSGIASVFSWFWLAAGFGSIILCIIIKYLVRHEILISGFLSNLVITVILVGVAVFAFIEGTLIYYTRQKAEQGMDYVLILGAQVRGTRITKSLKKRLDTANTYLNSNPKSIAIVSGGKGNGEMISEAEAMKQYLIIKGIASSRIIKEDKSTNTYENILYSKHFLKENSSTVIVTNGFHIFRAIGIAKKQGLKQVQGLAAPTDHLLSINYYVREAVGVIKDKLSGNL
ncbi:MAG: hypothetical protein K0S01_3569 [Herbinix sp.]|nr:hypothetical protein [Herbinix sp.]